MEWGTEFQVEESRLDMLYTYLISNNLLREKWPPGEPVDGGSQAWLIIQAGKKVYQTPNIRELANKERALLHGFLEELVDSAPPSAWDALHARHAEYVSGSQLGP